MQDFVNCEGCAAAATATTTTTATATTFICQLKVLKQRNEAVLLDFQKDYGCCVECRLGGNKGRSRKLEAIA